MLLYLLFTVAAFAAECETSTCLTCKTNSSCDWYNFDCLSKTSTTVTTLSLTATVTCPTCQAGSCTECQSQSGCSWFKSTIPGVPGKCDLNTTDSSVYEEVDICPSCYLTTDCSTCVTRGVNGTECGWYVLPGNIGGKCREASPSFAYTKVPADSCAAGNPCSGVLNCKKCQEVQGAANASVCNWYTSASPSFYNSKCDDKEAGVVDTKLYTAVSGTCPACAGTSCADCKAESGCKWVAVQGLTGIGFGECLTNAAATPTAKKEITTCPSTCNVHTCFDCAAISACNWFTASPGGVIDDSCDLASDATLQHPSQTAVTSPGSCGVCKADRCYECNKLPGCGWYAKKALGITLAQGCYATAPAGRVLVPNTDSKCEGVPSGSTHLAASVGVLFVLALVA